MPGKEESRFDGLLPYLNAMRDERGAPHLKPTRREVPQLGKGHGRLRKQRKQERQRRKAGRG